VTADIDGVTFEAEVKISVSPARELVLELSASGVRTTLNRPALLKIRAMDKLDGGTLVPADDADIIVTEPKNLADVVTAVPNSGQGALDTEIRQVGISHVASGDLLVEASVPTGTAEAHVEVWPATGPYVLTWERLDAPRPAPAQTAPPWRMTWDGEEGAWRCEPLLLKLMRGVDGGIEPQPIGSVEISDSRGWLELETAPEQAGEGSIVRVQGKAGRVRPEISEFDSPSSIRAVHPLPEYRPPVTPVYTVATFSASLEEGGEIVASLEVPCLVEPPQIRWHARQDEILRLSGEHHQIELTINSSSLPPHWQSRMEIMVAFNDPEAAERRGVALGHARARSSMVDDSGSFEGTAGATVDLSELPGDSDGDLSDDDLGWVSGTIQVTSSQLCFRKVDRVPEVPDPESLDLAVVVRSPYLGVTDRETIPVNVQPQLAALYLGAYPYKDYPWEDLKSLIQVIRDDQGAATSWSKLPLTLKHIATDGWPAPPVRWSFVDEEKDEGASEALDDHLTPSAGTASEYVAPHRARWEELGNPEERAIQCHIGSGEETAYVDEARDQDLYLSGAIQATLILAEALPKIKVAVGVKPSGLPDSVDGLALRDERIYDALNRSFVLEVDLQRLPLDRRET